MVETATLSDVNSLLLFCCCCLLLRFFVVYTYLRHTKQQQKSDSEFTSLTSRLQNENSRMKKFILKSIFLSFAMVHNGFNYCLYWKVRLIFVILWGRIARKFEKIKIWHDSNSTRLRQFSDVQKLHKSIEFFIFIIIKVIEERPSYNF